MRRQRRRPGRVAMLAIALIAISTLAAGCGSDGTVAPTMRSPQPEASPPTTPSPQSTVSPSPTTPSPQPTVSPSPTTPSPQREPSPPTTSIRSAPTAPPSPTTTQSTPSRQRVTTATVPAVSLAGVNLPDCTSPHRPVVLLHGTFSTLAMNFGRLVPALRAADRCVYGINYGHEGVDAITDSARAVTRFIATVRSVTGSDQVDVVGYSQGGLVLRTALRLDGLAPFVRIAVLIAPSFHGTTSPLAAAVPSGLCPACADQAAGSDLLTRLNAGGDLDGQVRYAVVSTTDDSVVTPVSSQVPHGPPSRVRSVTVQQECPNSHVDHLAIPANPGVVHWVVAALADAGRPPDDALTCG